MKKMIGGIILAAAGVVLAAGSDPGTSQSGRDKAFASLVESERAFSRLAEAKGIREAFLTWLAPDAVVFRPGPVEARPVYEKMDPANPAVLTWEPEVAEVAASGELGYTSGPYRVRPGPGRDPAGFGHYVSVWKKQPDGSWKVLLDIGVQHDPPASPVPAGNVATPHAEHERQALSPEALRDEELAFGQRAGAFIEETGMKGLRKALAAAATDDIRVYRPGRPPAVGKEALKDLIPAAAGRVIRDSPQRRAAYEVVVSWSGDLACSHGTSEFWKDQTTVETTAYLRIWRKDGSGVWKICLDIELPVPAAAEKKASPS
jgi:ketosteroid isomerase-like protein